MKKGLSWKKKGTKSEKSHYSDIQNNKSNDQLNPNEKGTKSESSQCEKITNSEPNLHDKSNKLKNRRLNYLIITLFMTGIRMPIDQLMLIFEYNNKSKFRDGYIKPLEVAVLL